MVFILRKFQAHPQASRAVPSAGGYGPYTADSAVLTEHLERLRQQQAVVLELIAAQHQSPDRHHSRSVAAQPLTDAAGGRPPRHLTASQIPSAVPLLSPDSGLNPVGGGRRGSAHDVVRIPH